MPYLVMSDECKIYYEVKGKGNRTLLFAHGLNSSHLKIKKFIDEFINEYRIVCYDQRGHGASDRAIKHMNINRLGQDMNEIIQYLDLKDVVAIGHSMGAATILNYVNQFGCNRLSKIIVVDMSPYMRNTVWEGGINQGKWTDEDFFSDMDRIFDNVGKANWYITQNMMNLKLKDIPKEMEDTMIVVYGNDCDTYTMASLWYSLFWADQRSAVSKITVPFLYIMPAFPLYSMTAVNFYKDNVKSDFVLEKDFPDTTHIILEEKPKDVAQKIKNFIQ